MGAAVGILSRSRLLWLDQLQDRSGWREKTVCITLWRGRGWAVSQVLAPCRRKGKSRPTDVDTGGENAEQTGDHSGLSKAARTASGELWKSRAFPTAYPRAAEIHPQAHRRHKPLRTKRKGSRESGSTPWTGAPTKTMILTTAERLENWQLPAPGRCPVADGIIDHRAHPLKAFRAAKCLPRSAGAHTPSGTSPGYSPGPPHWLQTKTRKTSSPGTQNR